MHISQSNDADIDISEKSQYRPKISANLYIGQALVSVVTMTTKIICLWKKDYDHVEIQFLHLKNF